MHECIYFKIVLDCILLFISMFNSPTRLGQKISLILTCISRVHVN